MPERDNLDPFRRVDHVVIKVIFDPGEKDAPHVGQPDVRGTAAGVGLRSDQSECALQFLFNGIGRGRTVPSPPSLCFANLTRRDGEAADANAQMRGTRADAGLWSRQ